MQTLHFISYLRVRRHLALMTDTAGSWIIPMVATCGGVTRGDRLRSDNSGLADRPDLIDLHAAVDVWRI